MVKIVAFAGARDVLGVGELGFPLAGETTARELLESVCTRFPALAPYRGCIRVAINGTYALDGDSVRDGDEVALIPPVSGG